MLAAAGLLDGYAATTHWALSDVLAAHDAIDVHSDQIFVHDRDRWTSAGVTAGIDLFLALVEEDHGPELAHQVATWLVVFVRRPGGQSQFSAQLRARPATHTVDRRAAALAQRSPRRRPRRRRARRPRRHEPAQLRPGVPARDGHDAGRVRRATAVEAARRLLEATDLTVGAIAHSVGIRHAETLHRAFRRRVGTTPDLLPPALRPAGLLTHDEESSHADRHRPLSPVHRPRRHRAVPGLHEHARRRCGRVRRARTGDLADDNGLLHFDIAHTFDDVPAPDVLLVPGGLITRKLARDGDPIIDWIQAAHPHTTYTTSVCTGALLLGAAGLLDGLRATTHWIAYDALRSYGAEPTEQRVVEEGKILTAAGVSAGIDLALTLVGRIAGARDRRRPSSSASSTTLSRRSTPAPRRRRRPRSASSYGPC